MPWWWYSIDVTPSKRKPSNLQPEGVHALFVLQVSKSQMRSLRRLTGIMRPSGRIMGRGI